MTERIPDHGGNCGCGRPGTCWETFLCGCERDHGTWFLCEAHEGMFCARCGAPHVSHERTRTDRYCGECQYVETS